ncbi:hypothetical protein D5F01_LYC24051 [Xyrichtys novacula]|uniref:Uncharacterized protein n=1 Tax=Xyrichtys novacula TaxID=13765 RepID=A0AAV1FWQ2_XYRNO|nr:hypothetical protein D5F01_LYC24051 [Xyrichtys novacula]
MRGFTFSGPVSRRLEEEEEEEEGGQKDDAYGVQATAAFASFQPGAVFEKEEDSTSDAPHVDGEEQESALYPPPSPGGSGPAPSARPAIPRGTVTSSLSLRVRSSRQLSRRRHGDGKDGPVVLRRRVPRSRIRPLTRRTSTERSRKVRLRGYGPRPSRGGESAEGEFGKREKRGTEDSSASRRAEKPPTLSCSRSGRLPPRRRFRRGRKGRATAAERVARGWRRMEDAWALERSCRGYCKLGVVASDTYDCLTSNSAYADSASRSEIASPSPTSIRPDNTVSVNDVDYCEKASDEREEGSRRSDERRAARDFYRDADSPRSRYEYDDYRSDAAELDVGGRFGEDEAWENNPDEERDRYGWLSRRRVENYIIVENMEHRPYGDSLVTPGDAEDTAEADLPRNSVADWRELFDRSDERRTPRDWEGTSDRDADFYRDSNSPWSHREYDDYRSDAAELEVEGRFGEDEAWRNTPDVEGTSDRDADFYRDSNGPRSRREYDDYRSDAAELEVEGRFGEDEPWRNTPDVEGTSDRDADFYRDSDGPRSRRQYDDYRSDAAELEVEGRFGEDEAWRNTPDVEGTSDRDADFYRDSDGPRSRRQYNDYRSDAAELEVEGRFGEDEAWRNAPDEEYDRRGLLSERHVEGDVVEDEECYPYGDSLGTPGDAEDTGEADLPRDGFMDRSELLNDEICIALWDCEEEVREEFGSNDRYAATCRWTELEESWKSFVGWLGERWWGSVSEESVRTFMDSSERRRVGDIVVSACFGDTPGGVCSFTVKTESGLLSLPLLIRRRRYVCADLAEGDFSCPIDMLRKLARETYTHLLPRPTTIPSDPQSFSLTRVVDDMWSVLELVKSGWSDVSRPHRIIQYLQNKEGPSVTPAALICCVDDDSPGYLFEIIDAKGKSLKVTFDKWGFTFGSGLHFSGLTSLLSHICEVDGVHFVINCRFLLTASEPERPM